VRRSRDHRRAAGFTRLEFAVAAVVFGMLVAALAERLLFYNEQAELVAAQQLVGTLRTALQVRAATLVSARGESGLATLAGANPISFLSEKPSNYLGEYYSPDLEELPQGNWLFDRAAGSLVYLPHGHKSFSFRTSKFLKFKVKFLRLPDPYQSTGQGQATQGVILDQVSDEAAVNTN
jgi:general secretion pathway protein G